MIYVVIAVHDRLASTRVCLDDLSRQDSVDMTVVVVDDGSSTVPLRRSLATTPRS